ncbi:unnamed protein product [Staurois parvus]|uniref:Uncharacterized protein n=1 Tax=Staurois parvus TaxID=386267 RepID=A0ABN9ACW9_9NEOB|nr:unnamed protein product [Staurois parvus]
MSCQSTPGCKVKRNPKYWVVTRTGMEGKSSNRDTSSGEKEGSPYLRVISSQFLFWL